MKVIAHRGASGEFPENTLLAFKKAIKQQADGIELDIQYHHSNTFMLLHDNYLDKTTNGNGVINDYSLVDLQKLDAGQGETIPTLNQALTVINGQCLVNIEIKSPTTEPQSLLTIISLLQQNLEQAINDNNFSWSQFVISSFNHPLLAEIKKHIPRASTAALVASCPINYAQCAQQLEAVSFNPSIEMLNQTLVDDAHHRGLKVWVYTVDREKDIAKCHSYGVDGIFTNFPKQTKRYIQKIEN